MPTVHQFGGSWTGKKLEFIQKYLTAYQNALKNQKFPKVYIDAFAGTGYRQRKPRDHQTISMFSDEEIQEFETGSAVIALEIDRPFDKYIFIESNPNHVQELFKLKAQYPERASRIKIVEGEANQKLLDWCKQKNPSERAVVFLDPYGMQVDWSVMQSLAATKTTDVWVLVPIGQAVNRLLTTNQMPPEEWSNKLTNFFGTDEWKRVFYTSSMDLFGEEVFDKQANFQNIASFFIDRLRNIFARVAPNYYFLYNSQNTPLYMLCFAAANEKGSSIAIKIAGDIMEKAKRS